MSGIMPMVNVPDAVQYGRVQAHLMAFFADTLDDGDQVPDEIPLEGVVVLTPTVGAVRFPTTAPPRTAVVQALRCPVIGGDLYPPDTPLEGPLPAQPGVVVVASSQPVGLPDTVQWTATFKLVGVKVQPGSVTFDVPANGVVDLTTVMPATPAPGTVVVVSTEDRERAEAAADAASVSATNAATSASAAQDARAGAEAAATVADDAMQAASQAASDADQSRVGAAASAVAAAVAEQGAVAAQDGLVVARDAAAGSASSAATSASEAVSSASSAATARSGAEASAATATQRASAAESSATAAATSAAAAQTARDTTLAAAILELRGTGQPGNTTETNNAPVGTYYTDNAGTAGAWRWLKTSTGSGVARWTVVYGDTGWRDVTPANHLLGTTGYVLARRIGGMVDLEVRIDADKSFTGTNTEVVIPTGLRKPSGKLVSSPARISSNTLWNLGATLYFATPKTNGLLYFSGTISAISVFPFSYPTDDPWPTTLPGTPA